jgi:hypothetical protein
MLAGVVVVVLGHVHGIKSPYGSNELCAETYAACSSTSAANAAPVNPAGDMYVLLTAVRRANNAANVAAWAGSCAKLCDSVGSDTTSNRHGPPFKWWHGQFVPLV